MRRKAGILLTCLLVGLVPILVGATSADKRGYGAGKYAIELDGVMAGWADSAEGGTASAEVVLEKAGPDYFVKKHIGQPKFEDITLRVGADMSPEFYAWVGSFLDGKPQRKSGSVIAANFDAKEAVRLDFTNGLITEVGFPALDAASKDAAKMTIKIRPEVTRRSLVEPEKHRPPTDQKTWLPSNFRLRIDGLDEPSARVNKIEALVIKQKVVENPVGEARDYEKEPAHLEIPNLVLTLPEANAEPMYSWLDDFVVKGNNGDDKEKSGSLEFLAPDMKEVLFRLDFKHLGIFKVTPEKVESGSESIRRVRAELYVESMSFSR